MDGDDTTDWRLLLPKGVRRLPADLAAAVAIVFVTAAAVFLPVINETPLRVLVGLPFVLFVPGYAFIAALFPEAGTSPPGAETRDETGDGDGEGARAGTTESVRDRGIDGIERVALSFGLSIAIVPLIGLVLNFTPWGIRLVPIMLGTGGFTLVATTVAARRRRELPPEDRFRVPYRAWLKSGREELFEPDSRTDAALNVLLVVSILLAVSSVAFAVAVPKQGESFTEFYLLTETDSGELVADDYPTEFTTGESEELVVGIGNQEHEPVNYTVVTKLQRVDIETKRRESATNTENQTATVTEITVTDEVELKRFRGRLQHNETWHRSYAVQPTLTGENLRLAFLLYRGSPPTDPSIDTAYRETHLWINVTDA